MGSGELPEPGGVVGFGVDGLVAATAAGAALKVAGAPAGAERGSSSARRVVAVVDANEPLLASAASSPERSIVDGRSTVLAVAASLAPAGEERSAILGRIPPVIDAA